MRYPKLWFQESLFWALWALVKEFKCRYSIESAAKTNNQKAANRPIDWPNPTRLLLYKRTVYRPSPCSSLAAIDLHQQNTAAQILFNGRSNRGFALSRRLYYLLYTLHWLEPASTKTLELVSNELVLSVFDRAEHPLFPSLLHELFSHLQGSGRCKR